MESSKDIYQWRESSIKAVIPFIVFIFFYFGLSLWIKDFSKVPITIAFIVASSTALILHHKEELNKKIELFAIGMGNKDIMIMCLIFILAGAFTASAHAVGGIQATVNIAQHLIPAKFMVLGLFFISAFISLSIGTSCGTIAAIVPIAVSISQTTGINPSFVLGATVGGAMFGDNLSLISDTSIAASRTQNIDMKDKLLCNLKIIIIPAMLCALLYTLPIFSGSNSVVAQENLTFDDYIKIIPYIFLLVFGVLGVNVVFLLVLGTIFNILIGLIYNIFNIFEAFSYIGNGTISMAETLIVAMLAGGLLFLVRYNGGITYIMKIVSRWIKSKKTCEIGICFLTGMVNFFTANNTVAIITSGSIIKELSNKHDVAPVRAASLMDITSCIVQGVIPYGPQILIATGLAMSIEASPFVVIKGTFYPIFMILGIIFSISRTKNKKIESKK